MSKESEKTKKPMKTSKIIGLAVSLVLDSLGLERTKSTIPFCLMTHLQDLFFCYDFLFFSYCLEMPSFLTCTCWIFIGFGGYVAR